MRIDGLGNEALLPAGNRAETVSAGDVIQGRVTATQDGRVQLRLTDGSTLTARVSEGISLEAGQVVRLQIGERQEGIPTARVLEQVAGGTRETGVRDTPEQAMGDALRSLGEKAVPVLVDRALQLVRETGMNEGQAAFLAANALEGSDPAAGMLGRILEGQFGFGNAWQTLTGKMAEAVAALPQADREALLGLLQQGEQTGKLAEALLSEAASALEQQVAPGREGDGLLQRNQVALGNALRDALTAMSGKTLSSQEALAVLKDALLSVPGGRLLLGVLVPGAEMDASLSAGAAETGTTGAGTAAGLAEAGTAGMTAGVAGGTDVAAGAGVAGGAGIAAAGAGGAIPPAPAMMPPAGGPIPVDGQPAVNGQPGLPAGNEAVPTQTVLLDPQVGWMGANIGGSFAPGVETAMNGILERLAAVTQEMPQAESSPEATRAAVVAAFDQAVTKAGVFPGAEGAVRELDVGKMAQAVRERLEWSSQALSRMDTDQAVALRPLLQDTTSAMRLFNQVTTYNTFVQVPLQINGQQARGELYVMKRKGGRGRIDASDFTLFLALDTENLGHMESLAHARNRQVTLNFRVSDEEVQTLLRELKPTLYTGLEEKGFRLIDLKVRTMEEEPVSPLTAFRVAEERLGRQGGVDVRL